MRTTKRKRTNGTKLQRKVKAAKLSTKRRIAVALAKYLKQVNPGRKVPAQVRVRKNRGGSITITPVRNAGAKGTRTSDWVYCAGCGDKIGGKTRKKVYYRGGAPFCKGCK